MKETTSLIRVESKKPLLLRDDRLAEEVREARKPKAKPAQESPTPRPERLPFGFD